MIFKCCSKGCSKLSGLSSDLIMTVPMISKLQSTVDMIDGYCNSLARFASIDGIPAYSLFYTVSPIVALMDKVSHR